MNEKQIAEENFVFKILWQKEAKNSILNLDCIKNLESGVNSYLCKEDCLIIFKNFYSIFLFVKNSNWKVIFETKLNLVTEKSNNKQYLRLVTY